VVEFTHEREYGLPGIGDKIPQSFDRQLAWQSRSIAMIDRRGTGVDLAKGAPMVQEDLTAGRWRAAEGSQYPPQLIVMMGPPRVREALKSRRQPATEPRGTVNRWPDPAAYVARRS
jgi:hypothetical protein